ncbi:Uncharacterised protein [Bordetella pertussis]|nr:Uncharacterised protein [Bordetella pertussis]CFP62842.1 Uncharacterised protein [Bordetella pertussis]CPK90023.1 Uncharacterised protein [Bordetella pertussis]CPM57864.1 Uncharacterised protein [Bordetella pertussis]
MSASLLARPSTGTMASSSISVNMSVDSSTASCGGVPPFNAVNALAIESW